ncbi:MAG: hypothetical protein ACREAB_05345, partial [Blastocatellia bacterium]
SYTMLVLGLFLGGYTVLMGVSKRWRNIGHITQCVVISLLVVALFYSLLWYLTGFNSASALMTAIDNQSKILPDLARSYPRTIFWDLFDFALGTGWISFLLAGLAVYRCACPVLLKRELQIILLALSQILAVAVTGLLQTETARVWIFMMPLLMIPVGLELRHWKFSYRIIAYFCLWLIFTAIYQNMIFIQTK